MIDIGILLKSDEMIEFLELYDLVVQYEFDRLHEGDSDSYTVESERLSLDLQFDAGQRCTTIFIRDPRAAVAQGLVAFPNLRTPAEVEAYAKANAWKLVRGPFWLRCDGPERCFHYEFGEENELKMVTIMASGLAPQVGHT
jgi:hypothetical protein